MSELRQITIRVTGRVQGVGFRAATRREVSRLGMDVTAENQRDGSVIIRARGTEEQLAAITEWSKHGPATAKVETHDVTSAD